MAALLCLLLLLGSAAAHLCLLSPLQRPPHDVEMWTQVGYSDCAVITGACGSSKQQPPQFYVPAAHNFSVVWQKNENHWVTGATGNFTLNIISPAAKRTYLLSSVPDSNTASGTLYSANVAVPSLSPGPVVLQVIYNTGNPAVPPQFYQCADIAVL